MRVQGAEEAKTFSKPSVVPTTPQIEHWGQHRSEWGIPEGEGKEKGRGSNDQSGGPSFPPWSAVVPWRFPLCPPLSLEGAASPLRYLGLWSGLASQWANDPPFWAWEIKFNFYSQRVGPEAKGREGRYYRTADKGRPTAECTGRKSGFLGRSIAPSGKIFVWSNFLTCLFSSCSRK